MSSARLPHQRTWQHTLNNTVFSTRTPRQVTQDASTNTAQLSVDITLQSLINLRFDIIPLTAGTPGRGQDFPGNRLARKRGHGIEFLDLRQYTHGDDVRHIDWNVTARTNEPYTRLYRQEKEQSTTVIVDVRRVMFNGSDCLRAVATARLAALTLWQASKAGDRCAALVVSSNGVSASRPMAGNNGVLQALELIASGFAQSRQHQHNQPSHDTPLSEALDIVLSHRRSSTSYLLFSGFDTAGDAKYDQTLLSSLALKRTSALLILDRLEIQPLPPGSYRYRSDQTRGRARITRDTATQLSRLLHHEVQKKQSTLSQSGIDTLTIDSTIAATDFLHMLHQHHWI